jgi:glycosyltransferase involved in cell wall biosynthesis
MADSIDISVLINTYNRPAALTRAVAALGRQEGAERWRTEIIVVDDGSSVSPATALSEAGLLETVRLEEAPHRGPGGARNIAVGLSRGKWIVFLGDDIVVEPGFLAAHGRLLEEAKEQRRMSLGHTHWDLGRVSKPFNDFAQAHLFEGFEAGQKVDFRFFYTANVALPRRALDEVGLFDESFTTYGWDDTDLGYRLLNAGWELVYNPAARAEHIHPRFSVAGLCRRQIDIGFGGCRFYAKHRGEPEVAFYAGTRQARPGPAWRRGLGALAAEVLERVAPRSALLQRIYGRLVFSCRCQGVALARKAFPDAGI